MKTNNDYSKTTHPSGYSEEWLRRNEEFLEKYNAKRHKRNPNWIIPSRDWKRKSTLRDGEKPRNSGRMNAHYGTYQSRQIRGWYDRKGDFIEE